MTMEAIIREVKSIELDERRIYESVLGHTLRANQRILIGVIEAEGEPDEVTRRLALSRAVEIARGGRAAVESQMISADEAEASINEAIREARRSSD